MTSNVSVFRKLVVTGGLLFAGAQLFRPSIPVKPATAELNASADVKRILDTHCYSCHSDQRRLSWFDEIVPGYWLVRHDILRARAHLNFSTLGSKPAPAQKATLYEAVNMIRFGAMPLPDFVRLHPETRVSSEELATLEAYLAPWAPGPVTTARQDTDAKAAAGVSIIPAGSAAPMPLSTVAAEWNGVAFDPNFENWKPISTTDRGDNNTFRFILGNDVAIKAAQTGHISPWPDGARFAKIAWQQDAEPDGLVRPGKFIQVELMAKDAELYRDTQGWGWGRWRGTKLKPYGSSAHFQDECTGCHQPMRGDDYVYTLPISAAMVHGREVVNQRAAALPANLRDVLSWRVITMFVDRKAHTMATLYGNDSAIHTARTYKPDPTGVSEPPAYEAGAELRLVTWVQREDPHWFGGRIPDAPRSVEVLQIGGAQARPQYQRFAGSELAQQPAPDDTARQRTNFMLGLAPVELP